MKIRWSDRALDDLITILAYIEQDSIRASKRVARTIRSRVRGLARHPQLGRIGQVAGSRELVLAPLPYIVVYRVADRHIEIARVLHGAQRWP